MVVRWNSHFEYGADLATTEMRSSFEGRLSRRLDGRSCRSVCRMLQQVRRRLNGPTWHYDSCSAQATVVLNWKEQRHGRACCLVVPELKSVRILGILKAVLVVSINPTRQVFG
jgi:hypothetical protein